MHGQDHQGSARDQASSQQLEQGGWVLYEWVMKAMERDSVQEQYFFMMRPSFVSP
jgi:hypothetical protein